MRKQLVALAVAGTVGIGGLAAAGPALAAVGATGAATVVDGRVGALTSALSGLVGKGTITQDQANAVATTLAQSPALRRPGGPGGFGRHFGAGLGLDVAAKAIGITPAQLRTELGNGTTAKSVADVAKAHNVDPQKVIDALVADAKTKVAAAVAAGRISQGQADARLSGLSAEVTNRVNTVRPEHGPRGRHHGPSGGMDEAPGVTPPVAPSASPTA